MGSLLDRDQTRAREKEYPNTAGNALKQVSQAGLQAHLAAQEKYISWVQELLKRDDVKFNIKLAILGGENPLVFGGEIPAIMMAKLEPLGVNVFKMSGGMVVSESNRGTSLDKTGVTSVTTGGVGTAFWHVDEQLTVKHNTQATQARKTDYRSRFDWSIEMGPQGEPEGVSLIKESVSQAFAGVMRINEKIVDAQEKIELAKLGALPTKKDAEESNQSTDLKGQKDDGDDFTDDDAGDEDANGNGDTSDDTGDTNGNGDDTSDDTGDDS